MTVRAGWSYSQGDEITPGLVVERRLGGGHRCEVYRAWDSSRSAEVAVKLLRPDRLDPRARKALAREAAVARAVVHPGVVRLVDAAPEAPRPHIVLAYAEGPTLSRTLKRRGALSEAAIVALGRSLAEALSAMHESSFVHLDVKPANVVVGPPARLIDLGAARTIDAARRRRSPIGTDAYMSPEQCRPGALGSPAPASDVWSLGVTLFEASRGVRPFPPGLRSGEGEVRWPQLGQPPSSGGAPTQLDELLLRCLRPVAASRPTAHDLAQAFARLTGEDDDEDARAAGRPARSRAN